MLNQKETLKEIITLISDSSISNDIITNKIKFYIEDGFNINTKYLRGNTLAHYIVKYKRCNIIRSLVGLGLNINICNDAYDAPLHRCVKGHLVSLAIELIESGADIDASSEFDQTPLHIAVAERDCSMVECLIMNGADVTLVDENNISAYQYASDDQNEEIINIFKKYTKEI